MDSYNNEKEDIRSLLPFGETIRPLVNASNLSDFDIKYLLQRRGIFVKHYPKSVTVPIVSTLLLSPKEFEILKNRQQKKEGNLKTSTAQTEWLNEAKNINSFIPDDLKALIENLLGVNLSYELNTLNNTFEDPNRLVISGDIIRKDWTKDVFSATSSHEWRLTIERLPGSKTLQYKSETTASETKELTDLIQTIIHNILKSKGAISKQATINKILSSHFKGYEYVFEYIYSFTNTTYNHLSFIRVVNIDSGLDNKKRFPEKFEWLKGYIDEISLHGNKVGESAIIETGKLGILIFGDLDAEFKINHPEVQGSCIIRFGFPKYYEKLTSVEFETKVIKVDLDHAFNHISKEKVKRLVLSDFQRSKYYLFEKLIRESKVDISPKDSYNQYKLFE